MGRSKKFIRQVISGAVGFPLLLIGLILIPLPGPGLIICFLALLVLSFGFDSAAGYLEKIKIEFKKIYDKARERADKIEKWGDK
jgi:hypothetical protein